MNENDTLLEELVTKAEKVENKIERVIDKGKDGERPPMVITHFSDAGTSLVWTRLHMSRARSIIICSAQY